MELEDNSIFLGGKEGKERKSIRGGKEGKVGKVGKVGKGSTSFTFLYTCILN